MMMLMCIINPWKPGGPVRFGSSRGNGSFVMNSRALYEASQGRVVALDLHGDGRFNMRRGLR
eukprot:6290118-Prorocentrum_lima.AAC.1